MTESANYEMHKVIGDIIELPGLDMVVYEDGPAISTSYKQQPREVKKIINDYLNGSGIECVSVNNKQQYPYGEYKVKMTYVNTKPMSSTEFKKIVDSYKLLINNNNLRKLLETNLSEDKSLNEGKNETLVEDLEESKIYTPSTLKYREALSKIEELKPGDRIIWTFEGETTSYRKQSNGSWRDTSDIFGATTLDDDETMADVLYSTPGTEAIQFVKNVPTRKASEVAGSVNRPDSTGGLYRSSRRATPYERTRAAVYATGNKWAIDNWKATHESLNEDVNENIEDEVENEIRKQLTAALGKKYKNLLIDFDDKYDDGSKFTVNVILYTKGEFLTSRYFTINYTSEYYDLVGDVSDFVNKIKYQIKHPDEDLVEKYPKQGDKSLKEDYNPRLQSDVYNALSDIVVKYHNKGIKITPKLMQIAFDWFDTHFWDEEGLGESCSKEELKEGHGQENINMMCVDMCKDALLNELGSDWRHKSLADIEDIVHSTVYRYNEANVQPEYEDEEFYSDEVNANDIYQYILDNEILKENKTSDDKTKSTLESCEKSMKEELTIAGVEAGRVGDEPYFDEWLWDIHKMTLDEVEVEPDTLDYYLREYDRFLDDFTDEWVNNFKLNESDEILDDEEEPVPYEDVFKSDEIKYQREWNPHGQSVDDVLADLRSWYGDDNVIVYPAESEDEGNYISVIDEYTGDEIEGYFFNDEGIVESLKEHYSKSMSEDFTDEDEEDIFDVELPDLNVVSRKGRRIKFEDDITKEDIDLVYGKLNENGLYFEVWSDDEELYIEVSGDWKHDHLFCDKLLQELGYAKIDEDVTEEDGSDNYTSIHTYQKLTSPFLDETLIKNKKVKLLKESSSIIDVFKANPNFIDIDQVEKDIIKGFKEEKDKNNNYLNYERDLYSIEGVTKDSDNNLILKLTNRRTGWDRLIKLNDQYFIDSLQSKGVKFTSPAYGSNSTKNHYFDNKLKDNIIVYKLYLDWLKHHDISDVYEPDNIEINDVNDEGEVIKLSKDEWKTLAKKAGTPRLKGESRAVVVDDCIYPSAASAIKFAISPAEFDRYKASKGKEKGSQFRNPTKDGDQLYNACESDHFHKGHLVKYATYDEIMNKLDTLTDLIGR